MEEGLTIAGYLIVHELPPDWTEQTFRAWWLPEWAGGRIIRPARMSQREKERYAVAVFSNILTSAGRSYALQYLASRTANTPAFAQYFGVGNVQINAVAPGDTSLAGEIARVVPSKANIVGTQVDIASFFGASQANTTWTNAGLFGVNATSTANSGTLMTHALISYTKSSSVSVTVDYLLNLN